MEIAFQIFRIFVVACLVLFCAAIFIAALIVNGEDERNSRTRYDQTEQEDKL